MNAEISNILRISGLPEHQYAADLIDALLVRVGALEAEMSQSDSVEKILNQIEIKFKDSRKSAHIESFLAQWFGEPNPGWDFKSMSEQVKAWKEAADATMAHRGELQEENKYLKTTVKSQGASLRLLASLLAGYTCPNKVYGECVELDRQPNPGPCFNSNKNLCWLRCPPESDHG